ncbi:MAG: spondin domain-containing protein [Thermoanaerobaculia bacterium]|nr:spondin domain-containing protein [Thermoanaerobaculia bacterium]
MFRTYNRRKFHPFALLLILIAVALPGWASSVDVTITVENLAPANGAYLTPMWVGAHAGDFDLYDAETEASAELERLAEDGNMDPLNALFIANSNGAQGAIFGSAGPIAPGETARFTATLDSENPNHRYFSYAAMVIPSNDAFISNGNPTAHPVFNELGAAIGGSFVVYGRDVLDAGTEVNDELPANTAFFGQAAPNTGMVEGGTVGLHSGLLAPGSGGIVDDPMFANADFAAFGARVARITISTTTVLEISITNLAPEHGNYLTPPWVGIHDGSFDTFDTGSSSSDALERLAEDGNTAPLSQLFLDSNSGLLDATVVGPNGPLAPGETAKLVLKVDGTLPTSRYLSFASMVIPSNDAFVGNESPHAFPLFDGQGEPRLGSYLVYGNDVLDAGTEVNDELPANTAFLGQAAADTGVTEGGVVTNHPGFKSPGSGGILDDENFSAAHFDANGYAVARVTVADQGSPSFLLHDRFRVSAVATDFEGVESQALGFATTDESGFLYFFERDNIEVLLKVIDGCTFNDHYWVFASGLTNVEVELIVEDLQAGVSYVLSNDLGVDFAPALDTQAFATCP